MCGAGLCGAGLCGAASAETSILSYSIRFDSIHRGLCVRHLGLRLWLVPPEEGEGQPFRLHLGHRVGGASKQLTHQLRRHPVQPRVSSPTKAQHSNKGLALQQRLSRLYHPTQGSALQPRRSRDSTTPPKRQQTLYAVEGGGAVQASISCGGTRSNKGASLQHRLNTPTKAEHSTLSQRRSRDSTTPPTLLKRLYAAEGGGGVQAYEA